MQINKNMVNHIYYHRKQFLIALYNFFFFSSSWGGRWGWSGKTEKWCQLCGYIRSFILVVSHKPPTINTWHPHTNKSVSVGAMGFPTGHQQTWKESCPPMQHMIGRETFFLSVDTEVIHVSALDQSLESLENTNSDSHQQRRKPLWKFRSQRM